MEFPSELRRKKREEDLRLQSEEELRQNRGGKLRHMELSKTPVVSMTKKPRRLPLESNEGLSVYNTRHFYGHSRNSQ